MKTKKTSLTSLKKCYSHPSIALFRAIELWTIHENLKNLELNQPSLDLGCGDGKIAKLLFDKNFTYGVDNGEARDVEEVIKKGIYQKVFLESAEKMSLSNNSVEFVFSNCVIEHIPNANAVLTEVARILKPGGKFVFTVPSHRFSDFLYLTEKFASWGLGFLSQFYKYRRNKMLHQFHCYSAQDWKRKLGQHGLKMIKFQYYMPREALMLWDKMALEIFFRKILDSEAERRVAEKYEHEMKKIYAGCETNVEDGAGLSIYCEKQELS